VWAISELQSSPQSLQLLLVGRKQLEPVVLLPEVLPSKPLQRLDFLLVIASAAQTERTSVVEAEEPPFPQPVELCLEVVAHPQRCSCT